jgi:hypothetical protein
MELRDALAKLRAGRRCEIDAIRMLELSELFRDAQQTYLRILNDGRPDSTTTTTSASMTVSSGGDASARTIADTDSEIDPE